MVCTLRVCADHRLALSDVFIGPFLGDNPSKVLFNLVDCKSKAWSKKVIIESIGIKKRNFQFQK